MTTNIQQGTLLDVLKKKMRQTKEEMEKYKDECEEYHKRLQVEIMRREETVDVLTPDILRYKVSKTFDENSCLHRKSERSSRSFFPGFTRENLFGKVVGVRVCSYATIAAVAPQRPTAQMAAFRVLLVHLTD
uniref:Uncharacterized protein n=1 Tax=Timema monikensis TaxID=170555 RepID=A0A7R9DZ78_9NEOP|nr:unnamed protein product [Timema monikensis]